MAWPRRLAVRTSGFHPENQGFESPRGHTTMPHGYRVMLQRLFRTSKNQSKHGRTYPPHVDLFLRRVYQVAPDSTKGFILNDANRIHGPGYSFWIQRSEVGLRDEQTSDAAVAQPIDWQD